MSTTEQIYALLVTANPVPDEDSLSGVTAPVRPHLRVVGPGTETTQSQEHEQEPSTEMRRRRRLIPILTVAAVIALIAGTAIIAERADLSIDSTPGRSIAEAGLPTEWKLTVRTQLTEVEGGVRLDSNIRLDSEQLSAAGTANQVANAVEMTQGGVVECAGTTYDEAFLWSATPHGAGELDFGDPGSITIQFDSVLVTSSNMAERATGPFNPRVCAQWSGTYTGASGNLADASGTFTAIFAVASGVIYPTWTFDS